MKKKMPYVLAGILLMISLVCMACGCVEVKKIKKEEFNWMGELK